MARLNNKPQWIIVHHSASDRDRTTILNINAWHRARWSRERSTLGFHVGYHFVILGNGTIKQTRVEKEYGVHTVTRDGMNFKSIGICLTGNFESEQPSVAQTEALARLIGEIRSRYQIPKERISYHGAHARTECCGNNLIAWLDGFKNDCA